MEDGRRDRSNSLHIVGKTAFSHIPTSTAGAALEFQLLSYVGKRLTFCDVSAILRFFLLGRLVGSPAKEPLLADSELCKTYPYSCELNCMLPP